MKCTSASWCIDVNWRKKNLEFKNKRLLRRPDFSAHVFSSAIYCFSNNRMGKLLHFNLRGIYFVGNYCDAKDDKKISKSDQNLFVSNLYQEKL